MWGAKEFELDQLRDGEDGGDGVTGVGGVSEQASCRVPGVLKVYEGLRMMSHKECCGGSGGCMEQRRRVMGGDELSC